MKNSSQGMLSPLFFYARRRYSGTRMSSQYMEYRGIGISPSG